MTADDRTRKCGKTKKVFDMNASVSVVLVGIGGYGGTYTTLLLDPAATGRAHIVGVVDPFATRALHYDRIKALGVPFFNSLGEFFAAGHQAELAVMSTPIALHAPLTCEALRNGAHVLCEKPLCALDAEADAMIAARDKAGKKVAIGYQWSYSSCIRALKTDILAGRLGRPKRLSTMVLWPRDDRYYARNNWAGARQNAHGDWVLDSPANNACAHYLHNMLFVLGERMETSAAPNTVQAELYRANPISNYDTAAFRIFTRCGTEILFYTTHACNKLRGPEFIYEFEQGVVTFERGGEVTAHGQDGTVKTYGAPDADGVYAKFWDTVAAVRGQGEVICGIETAMMQTRCINAAHLSCPEIADFPRDLVYKKGIPGAQTRVMTGLTEELEAAFTAKLLPHENGKSPWLKGGRIVKVQ